jgi:hypothetical protein
MKWTTFAILAFLCPATAAAQVVQGKIVESESGTPVANVEVRLQDNTRNLGSVVTDSTGRFTLRASAGGRFLLTTHHVGFAPVRAEVEVGTGAMVEVVLRLSVQPTELPAIEVIARGRAPDAALERQGFYERKSAGFGVFRTPEDIERRRPFTPSDLFQSISGVRVFYVDLRGKDIRMTRGEDPDCSPRIYIDNTIARRGGRQRSPGDPPLDVLVPLQAIHAIEIYRSPSETPQEYAGADTTCGVVVIWTKRG